MKIINQMTLFNKVLMLLIISSIFLQGTSCNPKTNRETETTKTTVATPTLSQALLTEIEPTEPISFTIDNEIPIRGVRVGWDYHDDPALVKQLKEMNVNWVEIVLWPQVTTDGRIFELYDSSRNEPTNIDDLIIESRKTEMVMKEAIQRWHSEGFKVFLLTYHERFADHHKYGEGITGDIDEMMRQAEEIAIRWAYIAEELKVEMYSPRKEIQSFVGIEKTQEWDRAIAPVINQIYHGSLVLGINYLYWCDYYNQTVYELEIPKNDIPGYDVLGIDFYGIGANNMDELRSCYASYLLKALEVQKQLNLKGIVFLELGIPNQKEPFWFDKNLGANEILEQIYEVFFPMGSKIVAGYFPWYWQNRRESLPGNRNEEILISETIGNYYKSPPVNYPLEDIAFNEENNSEINYRVDEELLNEEFIDGDNWRISVENPDSTIDFNNGTCFLKGSGSLNLKRPKNWENYRIIYLIKPVSGSFSVEFRRSDFGQYSIHVTPISKVHILKIDRTANEEKIIVLRDLLHLFEFDEWHSIQIVALGNQIQLSIDGDFISSLSDPYPLDNGSITLSFDGEIEVSQLLVEKVE